jgi:hypothetical protein
MCARPPRVLHVCVCLGTLPPPRRLGQVAEKRKAAAWLLAGRSGPDVQAALWKLFGAASNMHRIEGLAFSRAGSEGALQASAQGAKGQGRAALGSNQLTLAAIN